MMTLPEWINTKGALKLYRDWQENPITQIMLDGLLAMNRSARLSDPSGDKALQELGFRAGRDADLQLLGHLDEFLKTESDMDETKLQTIRYLVETEGYSEERAKELANQGEEA